MQNDVATNRDSRQRHKHTLKNGDKQEIITKEIALKDRDKCKQYQAKPDKTRQMGYAKYSRQI